MANIYTNSRTNIIMGNGGAVRVTIASNVGQGNGGTALPCRGCWVAAAGGNTGIIKMNIGAAATASLGVDLGRNWNYDGTTEASASTVNPLFVPIDDVDKLYFYGATDGDDVDILYLL